MRSKADEIKEMRGAINDLQNQTKNNNESTSTITATGVSGVLVPRPIHLSGSITRYAPIDEPYPPFEAIVFFFFLSLYAFPPESLRL